MKPIAILIILLTTIGFADDKSQMLQLYNQGHYLKACNLGFAQFRKNREDEAFISLYAYACLNSDLIDRLATPIVMLKLTKEGRANGAFLSAILMKKKLLHHALADGYDISGVKLPASSHILSTVFDLLAANQSKEENGTHILQDPHNIHTLYRTYMERKTRLPKIVIEKYHDGILKERHRYK